MFEFVMVDAADLVERARTSPHRAWWVGGWAATVALVAANLFVPDGWAGEGTYLLVVWGAAMAAWVGASRLPRDGRRVGLAIASGLTASAIGDAIYSTYYLTQPSVPDVHVGDVFWLGSYLALAAGLFWLLARPDRRNRLDVDGIIDVAAVLVVAMLLEWQLVISPTLGDPSLPLHVRVVWALYPALDAVILTLVVRGLVGRKARSSASVLLAAGAACWLISDYGYVATDGGLYRWLNSGWMLGAACLASGVWLSGRRDAAEQEPRDHVGLMRISVALVPLLIPGLIEAVTYVQGLDPNPIPLLAATAALVTLAFLRAARILQRERSARDALRAEKRYAHALAVHSSDAVAVLDADGRLRGDAPHLAELLGRPDTAGRGAELRSVVAPAHLETLGTTFRRALGAPGRVFEAEVEVRHGEGHDLWLAVRMVNRLDDPDVAGVVLNVHDITDRKAVEGELVRQAFHDGLTGLANRLLFADRVDHAVRRAERRDAQPAVVYLDLDGFKHINDSLGHAAGDALLKEVGDRLVLAVRAGDTVARLGGDEFAILIEESPRPLDEASGVAERVIQALRVPIDLPDRAVTITTSVGIALAEPDSTASTLLRDADIAMYRSKTSGRCRWTLYDGEMRMAAMERLELENDLVGAVDRGELRLVYQPVVNLETEEVVGFEALLRWQHPRLGLLTPDRFINIAEETGLIMPIGRWVLETACQMGSTWNAEFARPVPLSMAVNVSGRQLSDPDLIRYVSEALRRSRLTPSALVLEMTESVLIEDPSSAAIRLHELRRLGVRLAVDDFGTGYSSLSYLRQFPVDILKIDRSFIDTITERDKVPAIVRGLLDLGRTLEMETVAEGIEEDFQHDRLRQERCELGQGYLFARPLPPDEVELLMLASWCPPGSGDHHRGVPDAPASSTAGTPRWSAEEHAPRPT
jgi:diguanylate cyclase (GGDEF)-like protein/PAS domain S-box-containing protein